MKTYDLYKIGGNYMVMVDGVLHHFQYDWYRNKNRSDPLEFGIGIPVVLYQNDKPQYIKEIK